MENLRGSFSTNYLGQGSELIDEAITKISEHLALLRTCCVNAGDYVKFSKEEMELADAGGQ